MVLFNVGRYVLTGYSVFKSVWKGSLKEKDGKNNSHCYNSKLFQVHVSSTAMYSCYMGFLCQKILYKHGSASHWKNNFIPCRSFIVKAHQSTHSLAHGWFLIAFSWQRISAWTRQTWHDPHWVKINFCSPWCAVMNPSYLLPVILSSLLDWLNCSFHHWLNNSVGYSHAVNAHTGSPNSDPLLPVCTVLSPFFYPGISFSLSKIAAWVTNRAAQSPHE